MREPTVEIAHEALLGAWGRLRAWIDDARDDLRQERGLARAAAEWRGSDGDQSFLARRPTGATRRGPRSTDLSIGRPERAYLKASVDQRDREREEERRRAREARIERRSVRRLRGLVAVFAAAALVAAARSPSSRRTRATRRSERRGSRRRGARVGRSCEPGVRSGAQRPARERGRPDHPFSRRDRTCGREEVAAPAVVASRLELEVPGRRELAWSRTGVFVTEGQTRARSTSGTARQGRASSRSKGTMRTSTTWRSARTGPGSPPGMTAS